MLTDAASGPPPAEQNAGCLPALKLKLRLFARNVPFQTLLNFVKPVQTHGKVRINTGVMPVINNKNGMTNQSGNDDKQLADQRSQQKDERELSAPAPGAGLISTIPAPAFCTLPAYWHHNTFHAAAPRDSSIRCCIHCSTSLLYQRLLRPSLMGLGK